MIRTTAETTQADQIALACRIARMHGLDRIIAVGPLAPGSWAAADPGVPVVEVVTTDLASPVVPWFARRVRWPEDRTGPTPLSESVVARSVLLASSAGQRAEDPASDLVRSLIDRAPVAVVDASLAPDAEDSTIRRTDGWGVVPTFIAPYRSALGEARELVIIDRLVGSGSDRAPDGFRVVAVMTAFNEEDIIGPSIDTLIRQGIDVYVIDNWSSDRTYEIAGQFLGRGLIGIERFPDAPVRTFELRRILKRVEEVAAQRPGSWVVHHDADERRESPWPGQTLRDGLWTAHRTGFNAVDHTVLTFPPIDGSFEDGVDLKEQFSAFEFGADSGHLVQVKAWHQGGRKVDLVPSGGHSVAFPGRRTFPYNFLLKHYPIRSQAHGERKIHLERHSRWDPEERSRGWHHHYDDVIPGHGFVRDPRELIEFRQGATQSSYLLPLISRIGLVTPRTPAWARSGRIRWVAFEGMQRLTGSRAANRLRSSRLLRIPAIRRPLVWMMHRLVGQAGG